MLTESHESVTDTAVQSAVDTWEATWLDAPYSASWQWRLNAMFIRGINLSSSRTCCKIKQTMKQVCFVSQL